MHLPSNDGKRVPKPRTKPEHSRVPEGSPCLRTPLRRCRLPPHILPDSLLSSTPRLSVLYSLALGLACQLDAAEELAGNLARFLPAPDAAQQHSLLAQWQAISGLIARGRGDIERAEHFCTEALTALSAENYGQRHLCLSLLGNLALVRGDLWRARHLNREALEMAQP